MAASIGGCVPLRKARAVARQGREALVLTLAANETGSAKLAALNTRQWRKPTQRQSALNGTKSKTPWAKEADYVEC
jgi:hypothetical protein